MLTNVSFLCWCLWSCLSKAEYAWLSAHETLAHSMCVLCELGWVGWDHGTDFMNNRSRLPPEGSAKEEHLYGIKAMERMKESWRWEERERRDFGISLCVLESTTMQTSQSIKRADRAHCISAKWIREGTLHKIIKTVYWIFSLLFLQHIFNSIVWK